MRKIFKIFIGFLTGLLALILLVSALLSNKNNPVSAQEFSASRLVCDEPIPIGEATDLVSEILNTVYKELRDSQDYLDFAISHTEEMVAELYVYPETICDFSKCNPRVADTGPSIDFYITIPFWEDKKITGFCTPLCKPLECGGEPCPDLSDNLESIELAKGQINSSQEIINKIFTEESFLVTEDIREEADGTHITKFEAAQRKLKLAREWLHSTAEEGKRTCSLSTLERKKVAAGELGDRFPMRCSDALEQELYWPRAWSENCQNDCKEGPTKDCKDCLSLNPGLGASFLAQVNYKIYGVCGSYCQDEFTPECVTRLCADFSSEEECIAWICGGSVFNWVCCHESPLGVE